MPTQRTKGLTLIRTLAVTLTLATMCSIPLSWAGGPQDIADQSPMYSAFNSLDRNHDHKLSASEAAQDPDIAGKFAQTDANKNGSLSLTEYSEVKSAAQQERIGQYFDDSTITAMVKAEIVKEEGMQGLKISVETHKGAVILSGFVNTSSQAKRAVEIAAGVSGVQSVKDGLAIKS